MVFKSLAKLAIFTLALVLLQGCASSGALVPSSQFEDFRPQAPQNAASAQHPGAATDMGEMRIRWVLSDDVAKICNAATLRGVVPTVAQLSSPAWLTTKNTPKEYLACAIWDEPSKTCMVVTAKKTNHVIMGHEFRHCYEKNFH